MPAPPLGWINPEEAFFFFFSPPCRSSLGRICVSLGASGRRKEGIFCASAVSPEKTLGYWSQEQVLCASAHEHHVQFLMADGSPGRSKQLSHLFPSALWLLTFVAALKTVASWLNKGVFLTLPFPGNASLPWYCLKMLRGISVPSKLKLKIKRDQVRSSASVDCLDLSGFTSRTLLFTLSLRWSFEVTSQFWDSCVWFWLLRLGCPLPSFGKLKKSYTLSLLHMHSGLGLSGEVSFEVLSLPFVVMSFFQAKYRTVCMNTMKSRNKSNGCCCVSFLSVFSMCASQHCRVVFAQQDQEVWEASGRCLDTRKEIGKLYIQTW